MLHPTVEYSLFEHIMLSTRQMSQAGNIRQGENAYFLATIAKSSAVVVLRPVHPLLPGALQN
jgi:hypothetical protein